MQVIKVTKKGNIVLQDGWAGRKAYFHPTNVCRGCVLDGSLNCRDAPCSKIERTTYPGTPRNGQFRWEKP